MPALIEELCSAYTATTLIGVLGWASEAGEGGSVNEFPIYTPYSSLF